MKIPVLFLFFASGSALRVPRKSSLLATGAQPQSRPVQKILSILKDIQARNAADQAADQEVFDKAYCVCKVNKDKLMQSIGGDADKLKALQNYQNELALAAGTMKDDMAEATGNFETIGLNMEQADAANLKSVLSYRAYMYQVTKDKSSLQACLVILGKFYSSKAAFVQENRTQIQHLLANIHVPASFMQKAFASLSSEDQLHVHNTIFLEDQQKKVEAAAKPLTTCRAWAKEAGEDVNARCYGTMEAESNACQLQMHNGEAVESFAAFADDAANYKSTADYAKSAACTNIANYDYPIDPTQAGNNVVASLTEGMKYYGDWCACADLLKDSALDDDKVKCVSRVTQPITVQSKFKLCRSHPGSKGEFANLPSIGRLHGTLETMYRNMAKQEEARKAKEAARVKRFIEVRDAQELLKRQAEKEKKELEANLMANEVLTAEQAANIKAQQAGLSQQETLLAEIVQECDEVEIKKMWRDKIRITEKMALQDAMLLLTLNDSKDLWKDVFSAKASASFIQVSKDAAEPENRLRDIAKKYDHPILLHLADMLKAAPVGGTASIREEANGGGAYAKFGLVVQMIVAKDGLMDIIMRTIYADAEHSLWCGNTINTYKEGLTASSNSLEKNELFKKQYEQMSADALAAYSRAKEEMNAAKDLKTERATLYLQQLAQMDQERSDNVAAAKILHDVSVKLKVAWERYSSVDARWGVSNGFLQTTAKAQQPTAKDYVPEMTAKVGHSASKSRFQLEAALGVVTQMCTSLVEDIDARKIKMAADFEASQKQLQDIIDFQNGQWQEEWATKLAKDAKAAEYAGFAATALIDMSTKTKLILQTYENCKFTLDNYAARQEKGVEEWTALREVAGILTGMIPEQALDKSVFKMPSQHHFMKQIAESAGVYNKGRLMAKFDVKSLQGWKDRFDGSANEYSGDLEQTHTYTTTAAPVGANR